jgi:omega-amidase
VKLILIQPTLPEAGADLMDAIERAIGDQRLSPEDVVLLPEHTHQHTPRDVYRAAMRELALRLGAHIVGGSHHEARDGAMVDGAMVDGAMVNAGVVISPAGDVVGEYEKLRPYAAERRVVKPGDALGEVTIGGRRILITICADFWFGDLFLRADDLPDMILVPAFSVSRKPTPDYARSLWRHLAIARAYELGVYVGISDWAHHPGAPRPTTSGVGGFADPTTTDPQRFFTPIASDALAVTLSFEALDAFRADRMARGFFWKSPEA